MLDLQKYLSKAADDPGFKKRLIENANQAIKDEFGEDLPYELKCKEKLVFEVEPMDGLSDAELSNVAGGGPLTKSVKAFNPSNLKGTVFLPNDSNYGTYHTKDERGNPIKTNIMRSGNKTVEVPNKPRLGAIPDAELSGVAGGTTIKNAMPVDEWKKTMEKAGYVVDMYLDSRSDCGVFFRCYRPEDEMPFKESYYPCRDANGKLWMEV